MSKQNLFVTIWKKVHVQCDLWLKHSDPVLHLEGKSGSPAAVRMCVCPPEPVECQKPCQNGGVCVGFNVCRCADGFSGGLCETGKSTSASRFGSISVSFARVLRLLGVFTSCPQRSPPPVCPPADTAPPAARITPAHVLRARLDCAAKNCEWTVVLPFVYSVFGLKFPHSFDN